MPALIVAGVLLVAAAALIVPKLIGGITAPTDAANRYLATLQRGDLRASYAMLCAAGHEAFTYEAYEAQIRAEEAQAGRLERHRITNTMADFNGKDATVSVSVRTSRGTSEIQAELRKEAGEWKWCGSGPAPDEKGITVQIP